jgi:predicted aldo/keto reductase-like oxidoreductase
MIYKQYGHTGMRLSAVGFGGMRFDMSRSREENAELVRYACSQGINYFDTAPGYFDGQSEEIFGLAFKEMPGEYYVATKGMPVYHDTADKARKAVEESLKRLDTDHIDVYHVWCLRKMEHYELAMRPGGQYEGLLKCQEEGLISHIALSSHQPGGEVKRMVQDGKVVGVLLGVNLLNFPYRWDGVQAAYDAGMGVVAMNPLAGGIIPQNEALLSWLAGPGETPTQAALRFAISCPQITVALNGFTTREQVDLACAIADSAEAFTDADLARVRAHLSANLNAACTACGYCDDCPQRIPIPSYMQYYNKKQIFGADDEAMIRALGFEHDWGLLATRQADADACIACGQCEEACTQHLNIVERLREIAGWEAAKAAKV